LPDFQARFEDRLAINKDGVAIDDLDATRTAFENITRMEITCAVIGKSDECSLVR
jgi:hypothetical protein